MSSLPLVDAEHWPGVARTPYSPVRAAAARLILRRAVRQLPVVVLLPDGTRLGAGGAGAPVMEIVSDAFFHRIGADLKIGFGEAGVDAEVELRDYRDVQGQYDAVVSIEMIEAVGAQYWPTYFATIDRLLAPGGRFALQSITMPHDRLLATRHAQGWIHQYIFPGGLIPSLTAIAQIGATAGGFAIAHRRDLGPAYAHTLRLWRDRFTAHAAEVANLGFDAVFRRMWEFYLAYSEAGFRAGYLGVSQLALVRNS